MILITGGLGFIGTHTARALLDLGETCVLVQRRDAPLPSVLAQHTGTRVVLERADVTDREGFLDIGTRHPVTGIVHLAGSVPWPPGAQEPAQGARTAIGSLLTVIEAARAWDVRRVCVASTIGVYGGIDAPSPLREDLPLPMTSGHAIPAFKKIGELLADHLGGAMGVEIVSMRIAGVWGPLGRPASMFFPVPQLVHAAVHGREPDLSALYAPAYADGGADLCYVKDCGRAIALLQVAPNLNHRTYNVASGRLTTNRELAATIAEVVPGARVELPDGGAGGVAVYLDITRLREDTGYRPGYDIRAAVADYAGWLRAGNPR